MEVLFLVCGIMLGFIFFSSGDQSTIQDFKNPTCVENKVGKDLVKKCYEIKEVGNELIK